MHLSDKVSSNGTEDSRSPLKNQREKRSKRGGEKQQKTQHCVFCWEVEGNENHWKASLSEHRVVQ